MADMPAPQLVVENKPPVVPASDEKAGATLNPEETAKAEIDSTLVKTIQTDADRLTNSAAELLYDDEPLQTRVFERLRAVKNALANLERNLDARGALAGAEFEVKAVSSIIRKKEVIDREHKRIQSFVPLLIAAYILLLVGLIVAGAHFGSTDLTIPVINIPLAVLAWSGIGRLAAILYRFYTQEIGRLSNEIRWLIARPIIGVIMGSIAYLAVLSGMLILTTSDAKTEVREEIVWIAAFLGGFSDRFFEGVIATLLARLPASQNNPSQPATTA